MKKHGKTLGFLFFCILLSTLGACNDFMSAPPPPTNEISPNLRSSQTALNKTTTEKFITSDPAAFADKLKKLNNENEVLIVLKSASAPRISKTILQKLPIGGSTVAAVAEAKANETRRTKPGFARVDAQSRQAIKNILSAQNFENIAIPDFGHIVSVKIPENKTVEVITALLNNPNVDYLEANQRYSVTFSTRVVPFVEPILNIKPIGVTTPFLFSNPQGTNPADSKHTYHDVLDAWNYTRGSGERIGVFDSGYANDVTTYPTLSYHTDGQLISSTKGIKKLGFVDDYSGTFGYNCSNGNGQANGECLEWDDHGNNGYSTTGGHGTLMAGLVGENDNNIGYVGIAPDALTLSLKIVQNCNISGGCPSGNNSPYFIESDDWTKGIEWAINNNVDVLSMSFSSTGVGLSVYLALSDAYNNGDILLLASTGNPGDDKHLDYPQKYSFVMGVGGVKLDGSNYGKNQYEDISALYFGKSTDSSCNNLIQFCDPDGYAQVYGTSISTAVVAGIAGLVRDYNPSLSASQVWDRLVNTSVGSHNIVNAYNAVVNDIPLTVTITGPTYIDNSGNYNWEAMPEDGNTSYSYLWEYKESGVGNQWQNVGSNKTYSRYVNQETQSYQFELRVTVTSGSEQETAYTYIYVTEIGCPPNQIC